MEFPQTATKWSKDPTQVPHYSDWTITLSKHNDKDNAEPDVVGADTTANPTTTTTTTTTGYVKFEEDDEKYYTNQHEEEEALDDVREIRDKITITTTSSIEVLSRSSPSPSPPSPPVVASSPQPEPKAVTFHVHRCVLGPKSAYFTSLFLSTTNLETVVGTGAISDSNLQAQHSHISFPSSSFSEAAFELVVEAFEAVLEYCYFQKYTTKEEVFDGESPLALLFWCEYLHMDTIFDTFVHTYSEHLLATMSAERKLHLIYEDLLEYRAAGLTVDRIQTLVAQNCYQQPALLAPRTPFADLADRPLWLEVVAIIAKRHPHQDEDCHHQWSRNIVYFLARRKRNNQADGREEAAALFHTLTTEMVLPCLCKQAAVALLRDEDVHRRHRNNTSVDDNDDDADARDDQGSTTDDDKGSSKTLSTFVTSLQSRCVQSWVEAKLEDGTDPDLREAALGSMTVLPTTNVLECYVRRVLDAYRHDKDVWRHQLEVLGTDYRTVQDELHTAQASLEAQQQYLRLQGQHQLIQVPTTTPKTHHNNDSHSSSSSLAAAVAALPPCQE